MRAYTLTHLSDRDLLRDLGILVKQDRATTAALLAHIAEVDARRLYAPAGYPSMYEYCIGELRLSRDAAFKRIRAGRTARRFPKVFGALEDGRLHLSAVVLLTPYLTTENADDLLAATNGKSKSEIELLLAQRFPRTELLPMVSTLPAAASRSNEHLVSDPIEQHASKFDTGQQAPGPVQPPASRPKVAPIAPQRYALHLTMDQSTHEKLQYAQALLSHRIPQGDLAEVLDRALDALIGQLEKQKFAATNTPRPRPRHSTTNPRHIPAHVKRAVCA